MPDRKAEDLSPSVKNTRRRIQRTAKRSKELGDRDIAILVESGQMKPIAEWDLEELAQGRPRGKNGKFNGPRPKWLAATVKDEIRRRLGDEAQWEMIGYLPKAIALLFSILDDPDVDPRAKHPYLQLFFDRVLGKVDTPVSLTARPAFESMLADVIVLDDGRNAHPMIEGVVSRIKDEEIDDDEERRQPVRKRHTPE